MISWCVRGQFSDALEDHGVAAGQRRGDGAHAQDDRRVPRRDAQHHAGRLAQAHGQRARHVGGNHLAADLRGQRRRFADHAGGQHHVEAGPHAGGAGLAPAPASTNCGVLASSSSAAFSSSMRRSPGPVSLQVLKASAAASTAITASAGDGGRRARGDRAVQRVAALEGGVLFGRDLQAVDEHGQIGHVVLLRMDHRARRDGTTALRGSSRGAGV